jgi:predicted RND superfamily exporter protein
MYSNIDMISSLCTLMSRGALISMLCVLLVLPAVLVAFDGIITKTTLAQKV